MTPNDPALNITQKLTSDPAERRYWKPAHGIPARCLIDTLMHKAKANVTRPPSNLAQAPEGVHINNGQGHALEGGMPHLRSKKN